MEITMTAISERQCTKQTFCKKQNNLRYVFIHKKQVTLVAGPRIHFGAIKPGLQKVEYGRTSRFHVTPQNTTSIFDTPPNAFSSIHLFTHLTTSPKSTSCSAFLLFFIGSHTNRLGDGMRNPMIFAMFQAFKGTRRLPAQ